MHSDYVARHKYNQQNVKASVPQKTRITRNLAYRVTETRVMTQDDLNTQHYVTFWEDDAGRVKKRTYGGNTPPSHFLYDKQDRLLCETTNLVTSCPTSGTTIKNSHSLSPPFAAAGDWKRNLRPIPGSTGLINDFTIGTGTHQITSVAQSDGTPTLGSTILAYDARGSRTSDSNTSTLTNDDRTYTYDSRRNLTNVRGQYYTGGAWHYYNVASAFDAKNRRVFKSFYNETTLKTSQWFFYYDALDRLTEVRHTPDTSASATYSLFQLSWLGDRMVLYWQTDYPSVSTSRRYIGTDETGRPIDMICWSNTPGYNCPHVWTIDPTAWGIDNVVLGAGVFQPILFAGQYKDDETIAWQNDGVTVHRPGIVLNGFRSYDPFTGAYLQVDPLVESTWSSYVYVNGNPVGKKDPRGLAEDDGGWCWGYSSIEGFETNPNAPASCWNAENGDMPMGGPGGIGPGWNPGGGGGGGGGGGWGNPDDVEPEPPKVDCSWGGWAPGWGPSGASQHTTSYAGACETMDPNDGSLVDECNVCLAGCNVRQEFLNWNCNGGLGGFPSLHNCFDENDHLRADCVNDCIYRLSCPYPYIPDPWGEEITRCVFTYSFGIAMGEKCLPTYL